MGETLRQVDVNDTFTAENKCSTKYTTGTI